MSSPGSTSGTSEECTTLTALSIKQIARLEQLERANNDAFNRFKADVGGDF